MKPFTFRLYGRDQAWMKEVVIYARNMQRAIILLNEAYLYSSRYLKE